MSLIAAIDRLLGRLLRIRRLAVFLAFAGVLGAAQGQMVRLEGINDAGYGWSRTWVDVNNDGRDDYCLIAGSAGERLECYLSDGSQFGATKQVYAVPASTASNSVRWVDINGDGQVDLCRTYGNPPAYGPIGSTGGLTCRFGPSFVSAASVNIPFVANGQGLTDWTHAFTVDVNADGLADVCYLHVASPTTTLRCLLSNGSGFGAQLASWISMPIDGGLLYWAWPRGFYDFNGDGYPDFCRVVSTSQFKCLLGGAAGFTTTDVASPVLSMPYKEGASFLDLNGDGKVDFCRLIGSVGNYTLSCILSNGVGWESVERTSPTLDPGDATTRWWVDINADGLPDFCRATNSTTLACRLSRGDGDASTASAFVFSDVTVAVSDFGVTDGGRGFCDASGTGIQTYCRATYKTVSGPNSCYTDDSGQSICWPTTVGSSGISVGLTDTTLQARQPLLTAYTDGVGAETRITYLPMTNTDVYTRSGVGTFPRALITQPRALLVYESRAWQAGTQNALTGNARYFYKDLRNDTWSGSRGFRERWIFTEGSNSLDHIVFYQGLGPAVDASSQLDDPREVGLVKYQERFAVANGVLPAPPNSPLSTPRQSFLKTITSAARQLGAVPLVAPTASSPFLLLQSTANTLSDTTPVNPRYRYIGASNVKSWDWNGSAAVAMPTVETSTQLSDLGNVTRIVQTTTAPTGLWWRQTTTNNYDADNPSAWLLGRLTKASVTSESPTAEAQLAAHARKAGLSPNASDTSSTMPATPQPLPPGVLSAILQLLLDD